MHAHVHCAMPRAKKCKQKVSIYKKTTKLCPQRIYISDRRDSTPFVFQTFDSPNLSTPVLSDRLQVVQYTADRAERGWESQMFVGRVGCFPFYHWYLFFDWESFEGQNYLTTRGLEGERSFCVTCNCTSNTSGMDLNLLKCYSTEIPLRL